MEPLVTIITPTDGDKRLNKLFESLESQTVPWVHILLWDDKRDGEYSMQKSKKAKSPHCITVSKSGCTRYSIVVPGTFVRGPAAGSALRAIGMMAANTKYVTFADTDVWFDPKHLESLLESVDGKQWAYSKRMIWANESECLGIDEFESVGDSPKRRVPYEMVDNNTMIFSRRLGSSAAVLYRETKDYNDDRLMYQFLKSHAGQPGKTEMITVNQICPPRLEEMFRIHCTKVKNDRDS